MLSADAEQLSMTVATTLKAEERQPQSVSTPIPQNHEFKNIDQGERDESFSQKKIINDL